MMTTVTSNCDYLVEDVLSPNLRVVFCGTALGRQSYAAQAYYAHSQNRFWKTLHEVGLTTAGRPLEPREYRDVLKYKIGLTDLCKFNYGNDNDLRPENFDVQGLHDKIALFGPTFLAFTSKNAGRKYCGHKAELGLQQQTCEGTKVYILPSTSSRNWQWGETKQYWQAFAHEAQAAVPINLSAGGVADD